MESLKAKADADAKRIQQLEKELAESRGENKELRSLSSTANFEGRERAALTDLLEKELEEKRVLLSEVASLRLKIDQLQEEKVGSNNFEDLMVEKFNYLSKEKELLQFRLKETEEQHCEKLAEQTRIIEQLQRDSQQQRQNNELMRLHMSRLQAVSNDAIDQLAERLNSQFKVSLPVPASIGIIFSGLDAIAMKMREFELERQGEPRTSTYSIRSGAPSQQLPVGRVKPHMDEKLLKEKVLLEVAVARSERELEALRKRLAGCTCSK